MNTWEIIKKSVFGLLITVCFLSFALFLYFTQLLDIQKVSLKDGVFDLVNQKNEFEFGNLRNKLFNIVVRFYREEGSDYSRYSSLFSGEVPYAFDIELKDQENKIIKKDTFNQNNKFAAHGNEYFEWTLSRFNAEKGEKYKVKIVFSSDNKNYDSMKKEIFVQQDYDYAAKPFWYLLQRVFLVVFIATLLSILIMGFIMWRKKNKSAGRFK